MLYCVGPLVFDTDLMSFEKLKRKTSADFAKHPLLNAPEDYEFSGAGVAPLSLSGQMLPYHYAGGIDALALAHALVASGQPQWVMRGDGEALGYHQLMSFSEDHEMPSPDGIGFVIAHELSLERCRGPSAGGGADAIALLVGLIG